MRCQRLRSLLVHRKPSSWLCRLCSIPVMRCSCRPAFDLYYGQIKLAGGKVRPIPLAVDPITREWKLDIDAIGRAAATGNPKVLILNSPHNPTGTAFSQEEMEELAAVVRRTPAST